MTISKRVFATIVVVIIAASALAGVTLYSQNQQSQERSGPVSSWPASWTNVCNIPGVSGNETTNLSLLANYTPGLGNMSFDQLYSAIIDSSSFQAQTSGKGWVTTNWITMENSGPGYSASFVVTQFLLLSSGRPDGDLTTYYNMANGTVTASYDSPNISSCPAGGGSENQTTSGQSAFLDKPLPAYYASGEPVRITFSMGTDYTIPNYTISALSGCLYGFIIRAGGPEGDVVYNSTEHSLCPKTPLYTVIHPGQTYSQSFLWNQTYDNGTQVRPGSYEILKTHPTFLGGQPLGLVYLGTPVPISAETFASIFRESLYANQASYNLGDQVKMEVGWTNTAYEIVDAETNMCSLSYQILNMTNVVIYDSASHTSCGSFQENPIAPGGGPSATLIWNQTSDAGKQLGPGLYQAVVTFQIISGGNKMNTTERTVFEIGNTGTSSLDQLNVQSSSLSSEGQLWVGLVTTPNITSVHVYADGVSVEVKNYSAPCCAITYQMNLYAQINQTIPSDSNGSYEIVLVATFADGGTSATWTTPVNY